MASPPVTQDQRAPDQVAGGAPGTGVVQDMRAPTRSTARRSTVPTSAGMPTWPTNPQPIAKPVATTSTPVADDNGIDGGVLVAIGGGALLLVGGIGLAGRKRQQLVRQRQPA